MTALRIGTIILAAGTSSRMGSAKQLLRIGGTTLLGHVLARVRSANVDEIVLVLGHDADAIQHSIDARSTKIVINGRYREGMASSLAAGLAALDPEIGAAFIVLADQPFVRTETLDLLIESYRTTRAVIVVPTHNGTRGNPVLLDRSIFKEVMALRGEVGARAIFGNHSEEIVKVEVDDPGILLDFDNREDWEKYRRQNNASPGTSKEVNAPRPPRTDK
jgi:molybdenum cofactor cytidylyltransferase